MVSPLARKVPDSHTLSCLHILGLPSHNDKQSPEEI